MSLNELMPEAGRGLSLRLTSHQRAVTAEDGERIEYLFQPSRRHRTRVILSYDGRQDKPVVTVPYRYAGPQMLSDEFVLQRCDEIILQKREYVRWMRAQTHAVLDAAYCIAGGSGYILYRGRKTAVAVDATAKTSYVDVTGDDAVIRLALPQTCSRKEVDRALLALFKAQAKTVLGDLMEALLAQHIPEADRVAQALDLYVNGSLNFFNHRTTVDIRNRLVCFDIKGLGKNLKKPGMLIVQDAVWNTVTINRAIGRSTWYFVDEFHLLLKEEQTAAYSAEIWKRFRKWGGVPTGATQNPKDLLSSPEIENILENSDFIYMLNQAAGDRKILAERLGISAEQLAYVTNSEPGHGLLFFNNVILPFADDFPKDTELYKLLTTKPSEVEHAAETEA